MSDEEANAGCITRKELMKWLDGMKKKKNQVTASTK